MARFPTVARLAAAPPADVLRAWHGLGYNRRALNLRRAARSIVDRHGGRVPADLAALEALPGRRALHGSRRCRARLRPAGRRRRHERPARPRADRGRRAGASPPPACRRWPTRPFPSDEPGAWTHALMDLGATVCRPRQPRLCGVPGPPLVSGLPALDLAPSPRDHAGARPPPPRVPAVAVHGHDPLAARSDPRPAARRARHAWVEIDGPSASTSRDAASTDGPRGRSSTGSGMRTRVRAAPRRAPAAFRTADAPVGYASRAMPITVGATRRVTTPARRRSRDLRDGPARTSPRWAPRAALPAISAETMTGADRRAQALGIPEERAHGARRDGRRRRRPGARHGPRSVGDRPDRHPVRPRQQRRRRLRGRAPPGACRRPGHRRPSSPRRLARAGAAAARNWDRIARDTGSPRSTLPVARDVAMFGHGIEQGRGRRRRPARDRRPWALREPIRTAVEVIERARAAGVPVVAVDTPTAVDLSSGEPSDPAVRADLTVTFHRPKTGLLTRRGAAHAGKVLVAPIGIPRGGRSWLSPAASAVNRAGARSLVVAAAAVAVVLGAAILTELPPDGGPGGRVPHAARDRRADRRNRLAAVADLARDRPAPAAMIETAGLDAGAGQRSIAAGPTSTRSPTRPGMWSSSAAGSSAPARCSTRCRGACGRRSIEQDDIAAGTSSRSSRLIHGGLRYLEQFRFGLVREALAERSRLLRPRAAPRPHRAAALPDLRHPVRCRRRSTTRD